MRRFYKALCPDVCLLYMDSGETVDHFFLHCPLALGLWYRLFRLANLDWVPLRNIYDMMTISYKVFGSSIRGKVLWQTTCLAIIWVVWRERCVKIFQDKVRTLEALLDVIHFFASFCASCTTTFKGISLHVFQLDWFLVCSLKGVS